MEEKRYQVHASAFVDEGAKVGDGSRVWHFSHVMKGAVIGKNCVIGQNVFVASTAKLGNGVKVQNNVSIYDAVILEDDTFCGPSMVFTNVINPRSPIERKHEYMETLVKKGASIGANATVICGVTIGRYSFIGAGAVVTKNVPDFSLVYGNPSRQHGYICICGVKITDENRPQNLTCKACGKKFVARGDSLSEA